jgi:hypothetical protein
VCLCSLSQCIANDPLDPCCNALLAWEEECCLPRTIVANITARVRPREEEIEATCSKAPCVSSQLKDFADIALTVGNTGACSSVALTQSESTAQRMLQFYSDCKYLHFGEVDNKGLPCVDDADCLTGRYVFVCNVCMFLCCVLSAC